MRDIPETQYISPHGNVYQIKKSINGRTTYFGSAKTLIEALMKRDILESNNWPIPSVTYNHIYKTPYGKYHIKKCIDGKNKHFGSFNSYENAQKEVELLKKYNWDLQTVVELE